MPMIYELNEKGKAWRHRLLLPVFPWLSKAGLTANRITFIRALAGPAFVLLYPTRPFVAVWLLIAAGFLDWLDGGVARYQGKASDRGKFWDVVVDHINYVLPLYALLRTQLFDLDIFAYHLVIVPIVYLLSVIKESEHMTTDWIIHPYYSLVYVKPVTSIVFLLYLFAGIDYLNVTVLGLNVLLTVISLYFVFVIYRRWSSS